MAVVLALDFGSSSVRALVLHDGVGGQPPLARRSVTVEMGLDGKAEIDPAAYLGEVLDCLDDLHAQGRLDDVSDVVISSQWHSVVGVNEGGEPLGAALTWADTRAREQQVRHLDHGSLHARTGAWAHPQYWTLKAPWLLRKQPSTRMLLGLPELLTQRLLGDPSSSTSMASGTGLLDWSTGRWDDEALDLAGVPAGVLPPLQPAAWQGRLLLQWRRRWPALADAVWHPCVGDGAAANIGADCADASSVNVTIGTSAAVRLVERRLSARPLPEDLWRYRVDDELVVSGVALSAGGGSFAWLRDLTGLPHGGDPAGVGDVPPGSGGVTLLPFYAGSRAPRDVPAARGVISGLGLATTAAHLVSATMEAVCFEIVEGVEVLERYTGAAPDVVVCGGALEASPVWRSRLAGTLGRPIEVLREVELSARGAARLHVPASAGARPQRDVLEPRPADVEPLAAARVAYEHLRAVHGIAPLAARPTVS